jgi:class 3 adenylate cyclase
MTVGPATTATILFCDLVGSTELMSRLDDRADTVRRAVFAALRTAVASQGGTEVKSLGDGLMVAFPSAAAGLAGGIALQRAMARLNRAQRAGSLRLRVGVSVGDLAREDDDYFGPAVVEAARLCEEAAGGQILLSDTVLAVARYPSSLPVRALGRMRLKGLGDAIGVYELGWTATGPAVALPPTLAASERTRFVGRVDDRATVAAAVEQAAAGTRRTALVAGEPGIGKTRLVAAVAAEAHGRGITVLYGRCDPELGVAYQPVAEALGAFVAACDGDLLARHVEEHGGELARLVPDLARRVATLPPPRVGEPEGDRLRLFEAVDSLLAEAGLEAPVLLVLDDLHWAARPTLLLLRHLARSERPAALAVVGTFRDTELGPEHPLTALLGDLRRLADVARVELRGLAEDDVAELLESAAGRPLGSLGRRLARMVHAETQGNPFFAGEVVRSLVAGLAQAGDDHDLDAIAIPEGVREVVRGRLARMGEATRQVLAAAAVVGSDFPVDLVGETAGLSREDGLLDGLDEALGQRLVVEGDEAGRQYSFAHAIVRGTIYRDLSAPRRADLHRRAGEAVERLRGTGGPELPALAHHFCEAARAGTPGTAAKAAGYALGAARRAIDQLAYEQAADTLERAVAALEGEPGADPARGCDLLLALAETRLRTYDHAAVRDAGVRAAAAARAAASPERLARAAAWYSARAVAGEHDEVGMAMCEEALAALDPDARVERALVLAGLATQAAFAGQAERADAASREAVALAAATGEDEVHALALFARYYTLWGSERAEEQLALADELRALEVVLPNGLLASLDAERLRTYPNLVLGRREPFLASVAEVARTGRDLRSRYFLAAAAMWRGCLMLLEGRFDEFDDTMADRGGLVGDDPNFRNALSAQLFHRYFEQGRLADLLPLVAGFVQAAPGLAGFRAALALAHVEAGDLAAARALVEELAPGRFAGVPRDVSWPATLAVLSEVGAALGDPGWAGVLGDLLRPYAGQLLVLSAGYCPGAADRYLGMAAAVAGRLDEAAARHRSAIDLEERIGARPLVARSQAWLGRALAARDGPGDAAEAARLARAARAAAEEMGMGRLAQQAGSLVDAR